MASEDEKIEYTLQCMSLNMKLDIVLDGAASPRVIVAVFVKKLAELCEMQENPFSAMDQVLASLINFQKDFKLAEKQSQEEENLKDSQQEYPLQQESSVLQKCKE